MSQHSKKVDYCVLLTIICLSLSFKMSYINQQGGDTWGIGTSVVSFMQEGVVTWMISPLSYYGWYPYSQPAGGPLFISAFALVTTLENPVIAYFLPVYWGVLGLLGLYILTREFSKDSITSWLAVFLLAIFGVVIFQSWNNLSTRGLFLALYPPSLFLLLRSFDALRGTAFRGFNLNYFSLFTIGLFSFASVHRMVILFVFTTLAPFVLIISINLLWRNSGFTLSQDKMNVRIFFAFSLLFLAITSGFLSIVEYEWALQEQNQKHLWGYGDDLITRNLNLASDYSTLYNQIVIFGIFIIPSLIFKTQRRVVENYLIIILFTCLVFILDIKYFLIFLAPLASLFVALGIRYFIEIMDKNIMVSKLFLVTFIFSGIQFIFWYIEKNYYILSLIGGIAILLISYYLFSSSKIIQADKNNKFKVYVLAGLILQSILQASSISHFRSMDRLDEYDEGHGAIIIEFERYDAAMWMKDYGGSWVAESSGIRNQVWVLSEIPEAGNDVVLYNNLLFLEELDQEVNLTVFYTKFKTLYRYEIDLMHDPSDVEFSIIHDRKYAEFYIDVYNVDTVLFTSAYIQIYEETGIVPESVRGPMNLIPYCSEQSYETYSSNEISIFHINYT